MESGKTCSYMVPKLVAHQTWHVFWIKNKKIGNLNWRKQKPCSNLEGCMWCIHINLMLTCLRVIVAKNWVWTTWIEYETKLLQTKPNMRGHKGKFQELVTRSCSYPINQMNHGCWTGQTYPCSTTLASLHPPQCANPPQALWKENCHRPLFKNFGCWFHFKNHIEKLLKCCH